MSNTAKVPRAARPTQLSYLTACRLIWRACPFVRVRRCRTLPWADIFRAQTGPQGLTLMAENDWADSCGRFRLRIYDGTGSGTITQYFNPKTLARDFAFEDDERLKAKGYIKASKGNLTVETYWYKGGITHEKKQT